jgi:plasmid maintenance system killer protein
MLDAAEISQTFACHPVTAGGAVRRPRRPVQIRINRQWRICFRWSVSGPEDIQIIAYH